MKSEKSYKIALSGVSSALAIIALMLAIFLPTMKLAFFTIAGLCVSIPLTLNMLSGAACVYVVTSLIGFLAGNIKALPFIFFFGLYSIIAWACDFKFYKNKKLPKWLKIILIIVIKIAFFAISFFACYKLMNLVVSDVVLGSWTLTIPVLWIIGFVLYSLYDLGYRIVFKVLGSRLSNIGVGKKSPKKDIIIEDKEDEYDDIFEDAMNIEAPKDTPLEDPNEKDELDESNDKEDKQDKSQDNKKEN